MAWVFRHRILPFTFKLTVAERWVLHRLARKYEVAESTMLRKLLMQYAPYIKDWPPTTEELEAFYQERKNGPK